jgi:hypothetical protein
MARNWVPPSTLELNGATIFDSIFFLGIVKDRATTNFEIILPDSVGAFSLI